MKNVAAFLTILTAILALGAVVTLLGWWISDIDGGGDLIIWIFVFTTGVSVGFLALLAQAYYQHKEISELLESLRSDEE
jgi:hypothetical protein